MKTFALCVLAALAALPASAQSARGLMHEARAAYNKEDYNAALESFEKAADLAEAAKLDPAKARYNAGLALLRLGRSAEAADRFADALRSSDLGLQVLAYYNRGVALHHLVEQLESQSKLEEALRTAAEARVMFERALALKPEDRDAKVNLELQSRYIALLLEQGRMAESLVGRVESLVSTYRFKEALDVISREAPALARGLALKTEAGKKLQEMTQRINEVLGILHPPAAQGGAVTP